jgi:hypothetical protein
MGFMKGEIMSYQPTYPNYGGATPYYNNPMPSPYQNNIPFPSPYQTNIPMPQYTPMPNQTSQQPQFVPVQIHGHTIKDENTEIAPNDVPMDGTVSLFPTENYSCIFAKHWNKDGKITTTKFVPVPMDEDYVPTPGFEDEMRSRMDELKQLIQQERRSYNKKPNYNRNKQNGETDGTVRS